MIDKWVLSAQVKKKSKSLESGRYRQLLFKIQYSVITSCQENGANGIWVYCITTV